MRLFIARHGRAEDTSPGGDTTRCLTRTGERELELMAARLREVGCTPDLIVHSPLVRTSQTAELFQRGLGVGELLSSERLKPGASPSVVIAELEGLAEFQSVMLVGHAPDVSIWSYKFIAHEPERQLRFEPGTVAGFEFSGGISEKAAQLRCFITPRELGGF